jgi:Ni/Co efflux regulator RcnB
MKRSIARPLRLAVFALSAALAAGSALADKPDWAGNGKNKGKKHEERQEQRGSPVYRFTDQHRRLIAEYYAGQAQPGRKCPPGLAKKNNGCMPPGQAKKWGMGRPLPGDVRYYGLPQDLLRRLPPAPAGHRYVRVAADILLIAVGSSMVIDAIEDIVR